MSQPRSNAYKIAFVWWSVFVFATFIAAATQMPPINASIPFPHPLLTLVWCDLLAWGVGVIIIAAAKYIFS